MHEQIQRHNASKLKNRFRPDKYMQYWRINTTADTTNRMQLHMQDENNALAHCNLIVKPIKRSKADSALDLILNS